MRVLTIVDGMGPPLARGTRIIHEHLIELERRGVQNHVLTLVDFRMEAEWQAWATKESARSGTLFHPIRIPGLLRFHGLHMALSRLEYCREALRLHKIHRFDLIHEYSSTPLMLTRSALISQKTGAPVLHTLCVRNDRWWNPTGWRHGIDRVKKVICSTKRLAEDLLAQGFPQEKVLWLPLGVNCRTFHPNTEGTEALRREFGWPSDRPIILYLGPLVRSKGAQVLAAALPRVFEETSAACIFACQPGPRWQDSEVASQVRTLCAQQPSRCRIQEGFHPVERFLQAADLVVLPLTSAHGTLLPPQTLLEAMASAKAVVATKVYGIEDWIQDTVTGRLVPPADPEKLSRCLVEIIKDPSTQKQLGERARQFVEAWDVTKVTTQLYDLYDQLVAQPVPVAVP